ncbi:MAG: SGNH/GDSL hydrolase family protein [Phascolarctobacterium sp.]|nr:SGNH/GDSL hydrolase family protein [Phascolarctobacterium sp.]
MAASEKSKDYVHIFENISKCKTDVMNYYQWEIMHNDRAETYNLIEPYLARKYDLVVLQLGENISNTDTLEQDFRDLIKHIQLKLNDARVIVIGNFWNNKKIEMIKQNICDGKQVAYIDLRDLQDKQYYAGLGTEVKGDDGMTHIIEHIGVANHPDDKAMQIVAERIFALIR